MNLTNTEHMIPFLHCYKHNLQIYLSFVSFEMDWNNTAIISTIKINQIQGYKFWELAETFIIKQTNVSLDETSFFDNKNSPECQCTTSKIKIYLFN